MPSWFPSFQVVTSPGRHRAQGHLQAVVDLAVRTKLLQDLVDAWLLQQPSLVNKRKKALLPVVSQRQGLADALSRYMGQLGLKRTPKPVPRLAEYIAGRTGQDDRDC